MAEWLNALVLKTGEPQGFGGSNPSPSAKIFNPFTQREPVARLFFMSGACFLASFGGIE